MPSIPYGVCLGTINKSIVRTGDDSISAEVTLPVGQAVTSWVKTDANTAACVLAGGHGQTSGTYDVYWSGGYRYGVTGTVTVNALDLDGGSGTDFPASATANIVVCKQVIINKAIDGDNVSIIGFGIDVAASTGYGTRLTFFDTLSAGGSAVGSGILLEPNEPLVIDVTGGSTNLLTGSPILSLTASNGDATYAATLKIQGVQDVTP